MAFQEERLIDQYIRSAGNQEGDRVILTVGELVWLIGATYRWNTLRLRFLAALQRVLPGGREQDSETTTQGGLEELKGTLTNIIIMQSRLNEREEPLVSLLEDAAKKGLVEGVALDVGEIRQVVMQTLQAYQHVEEQASLSGG